MYSFRPKQVIQHPSTPGNCLERWWHCNSGLLQKPFEDRSWFQRVTCRDHWRWSLATCHLKQKINPNNNVLYIIIVVGCSENWMSSECSFLDYHHNHSSKKHPFLLHQAKVRRLSLHTSLKIAQQAIQCHLSHILSESSCDCPYLSPLPPPCFCKMTPNPPHFYVLDAQTTSICHASQHQSHSE